MATVSGPTSVCRSGLPPDLVLHWWKQGFVDAGPDPSLHDVVTDTVYYRNSQHTPDYVRRTWSRFFEILDLYPGYIGNNQDLVVMRRPA
jgi:hypothetical protein